MDSVPTAVLEVAQEVFLKALHYPKSMAEYVREKGVRVGGAHAHHLLYIPLRRVFEDRESWEMSLWRFVQWHEHKLPSGWNARRLCNFIYDNRDSFKWGVER